MQNDSKQVYLSLMGIDVWQKKMEEGSGAISSASVTNSESQDSWDHLQQAVNACTLCELSKTRTHAVFGVGDPHADLLFIGEAPGANEDLQGEPFVGRAGMLLNAMLRAISLDRSNVYIANVLKCRPPNNRDPSPQEVSICTPYLQQQITLIKPKLIVAVGRIAAQFLLKTDDSMANLRGRQHYYDCGAEKIPLMVTYHPAYLLRSPREKSKAYTDFLAIRSALRG